MVRMFVFGKTNGYLLLLGLLPPITLFWTPTWLPLTNLLIREGTVGTVSLLVIGFPLPSLRLSLKSLSAPLLILISLFGGKMSMESSLFVVLTALFKVTKPNRLVRTPMTLSLIHFEGHLEDENSSQGKSFCLESQ